MSGEEESAKINMRVSRMETSFVFKKRDHERLEVPYIQRCSNVRKRLVIPDISEFSAPKSHNRNR